MIQEIKSYIERSGLTLEVVVYYYLGGMNYFSGDKEKRGYYLSVCPVQVTRREDGTILNRSYTMFSGTKIMILEVARQSKSAFENAQKLAEDKKEELILSVITKNQSKVKATQE